MKPPHRPGSQPPRRPAPPLNSGAPKPQSPVNGPVSLPESQAKAPKVPTVSKGAPGPKSVSPGRPGSGQGKVGQIVAANARAKQVSQTRTVLLSLLGIAGAWIGVQEYNSRNSKVVVQAAPQAEAPAPRKQPAGPAAEVPAGPTQAIAGFDELMKESKFPVSPDPEIKPGAVASNDSGTPSGEDAVATGPEDIFSDDKLVLVGIDSTRESNIKRDGELLAQALKQNAWDSYRKMLDRSIEAALPLLRESDGRNRFDEYWKTPAFYKAFLRWQMLNRFSGDEIQEVAHDSRAQDMILWMLNTPEIMEEVLLTLSPKDNAARVLVLLKDAWTAQEDVAKKYFNLSLACAVVFDKPMAIRAPGGNVETSETVVDPLQRYLWYVEKDKKGKMATPIDKMPARDLVYVVCSPVITSELEWAVAKMSLRWKNWGDAYGMVNYLMERAVKGINPYEAYTFEEILKEGGICGDQSYFCANTARANGIPAMIFAGETDLGGHAWVALKIKDDEWTTGVGRIGGVSKGQTDNPQIGGGLTEQEVWLWNDRDHQSRPSTLGVFRHLWLTDYFSAHEKKKLAGESARLANTIGNSFVETWTKLYDVLEDETEASGDGSKPEIVGNWKKFAADMRHEFRENPRMAALAAQAENDHIFPYSEAGDIKRAFNRDRRRVEREAAEQKDLLAESLKRQGDVLMKKNDPDARKEIERLYDPALRDYGGSITGFKMISADYFNFMKDDPDRAKKVVRDIELAFNRVVKTNSGDFFRTKTESGIVDTIAGYYRQVGDEDRAKLLKKRYEREMFRAERGAL